MRDLRQAAHVHIRLQGHAPAVNLQDVQPPAAIRYRNRDLPVKPAGPPQGRVQRVGKVGGADDNHILPLVQPVHQRQQLGHHPLFHLAHHLLAPRGNGVNLIQENNARPLPRRLLEDLAQMRLALPVEFVDDLRPAHGKEIGLGFMRDGPRDQRLAAAGRTVQQHPFGRVYAQPLEHFRIAQRQFYHFPDAVQLGLEAADVFIRHSHPGALLDLRFADHQFGRRIDQHRPAGQRVFHPEISGTAPKQRRPNPVPGLHRQAVQQAADVFQVPPVRRNRQRRQPDALGRAHGDFAHLDKLVERGPGVLARQAVQLHARLAPQFLVGRHHFADRGAFAGDFHGVPNGRLQPLQVFRPDARQSAAHVPANRLRHLEFQLPRFRLVHTLDSLHLTHLISSTPLLQVRPIFSLG